MDPGGVSSFEYKYSVTQFPPGGYRYVKWWDVGTGCDPIRGNRMKVERPRMAPKGAGLSFSTFFSPHFFDGLDLPSTRGPLYVRIGPP